MFTMRLNTIKKEIENAQKICILGVGNTQKGDDGAGPGVIKILQKSLKKENLNNLKLIDCGEIPENFTGDIRKFKPDLTIIIDACISGRKPGAVYIVNPEKIQPQDFSTHRLPLSMFVKFLEETIPTKVIVIGVEPKNINYGDEISSEVNKAIEEIVSLFTNHLC
ncbi:MAG: hydrogenase maturation peptidase HycI [candidate division WOR-3 bacterium]|nr:hydrogenase maturation peptidase HycI [candidate division WOR-3 bacterium]